MKKTIVFVVIAILSFTMHPFAANAWVKTNTTLTSNASSIEAARLTDRLREIRAIDASALSGQEKKVLRKEVRSIKEQLTGLDGGVYISAGALILIVLLLVLLL